MTMKTQQTTSEPLPACAASGTFAAALAKALRPFIHSHPRLTVFQLAVMAQCPFVGSRPLARKMNVSHSAVLYAVEALRDNGYITTQCTSTKSGLNNHGRLREVILTDEGKRLMRCQNDKVEPRDQ